MHIMKLIKFVIFFMIRQVVNSVDEQTIVRVLRSCRIEHHIPFDGMAVGKNRQNFENPTKNVLCFMKCIADKDDSLDEIGKVKIESLEKSLAAMNFEDTVLEKVKKCVMKLPPVKQCEDMREFLKCLPNFDGTLEPKKG
ncbi:uncharacterized protein LOC123320162 [Coccinella septempunctata]|uniref:uncharacterized protein LOC123320162 n=1 Tax=Coccinella septempunctata TaxID=41139 RepID=UPI001D095F4D|nr:uncharacterized protein LOC123320162 [Coccinella septempunctata]